MWCSAIVYGRVSPLFLGWNPSTAWPPKGASLRRCPKGILLKKGALAPFLLYCAGSGQFAVFVDAGYFWVQSTYITHRQRTGREGVTIDYPQLRAELINEAQAQFTNADLLRVYCYDGPGTYGKTLSHQAIEAVDDFKLRLGTRSGVGDQKAVDGLIIADLISLAQNKSITDALLLSGDADLTPGVLAAQSMGIRVHLLTMGPAEATSPFLRAEADCKIHWEDTAVQRFGSAANGSVPQSTTAAPLSNPAIQPSAGARARLRPHRPKHFCST